MSNKYDDLPCFSPQMVWGRTKRHLMTLEKQNVLLHAYTCKKTFGTQKKKSNFCNFSEYHRLGSPKQKKKKRDF
jgi:hypothetical protein